MSKGIQRLFIVQQTSPQVYRLNNTFFSPTQLMTYYPSEYAGFVPSASYEVVSKIDDKAKLTLLSDKTSELRTLMAKYHVAAITKINETSLNLVFGGLGDNHWEW